MEHPLLNHRHMTVPIRRSRNSSRGFTLVEILVTLGIIAVVLGVAAPNIAGMVRSQKIRAAQDLVAGALQRARARAIGTNTQYGVTFVVESATDANAPLGAPFIPTVFWVHNEDPRPPAPGQPLELTRMPFTVAGANPAVSTRYVLDPDVTISVVGGVCPGVAAATQPSVRFDRYGVRTFPGFVSADPTPPALTGLGPSIAGVVATTTSGEATICLLDMRTRMTRTVLVASSGRIRKGGN
jgi:prepilin-type N-terminal cleavage/methylation domain-containing protein